VENLNFRSKQNLKYFGSQLKYFSNEILLYYLRQL